MTTPRTGLPHEFDHTHSDVSGGWLRAASFGAMDGLVSNTALIAGVAAGADRHTRRAQRRRRFARGRVLDGAGGVHVRHDGQRADRLRGPPRTSRVPHASAGRDGRARFDADRRWACPRRQRVRPAKEIHRDENQALNLHMVTELGIDPREKPSARLAADLVVRACSRSARSSR